MSHRRTWGVRAAIPLVLALVVACAPSAAPPPAPAKTAGSTAPAPAAPAAPAAPTAASREPRTLTVGFIALAGFQYLNWVGEHLGFFGEMGVVQERVQFQNINDALAAMASGSLDTSTGTTDVCLTALTRGASIKLIADLVGEAPYDLVVRPEITSVADLRGKKIGASALRGSTATIIRAMLSARGLTDNDYDLTLAGGNPQRLAALQTGGIDATVLSEPSNLAARAEGYRALLSFPDVVPGFAFTGWWVPREPRGAEFDQALAGFLAGLIRAKAWAHAPENRERMIALFGEEGRVARPVAEQTYDYYVVQNPRMVDASDLRLEPVQTVARLLRELEELPPLPPESQWVDRSYVERARQLAATRG